MAGRSKPVFLREIVQVAHHALVSVAKTQVLPSLPLRSPAELGRVGVGKRCRSGGGGGGGGGGSATVRCEEEERRETERQ
ncbi:hypothetical protein NL676_038341 [Syzygium grande]|nr:hypothetical protein NL676_038341 [Syzygium grande]